MIKIALYLTAANFGYQFLTGQNWAAAIERSWFQFTAILTVWSLQTR